MPFCPSKSIRLLQTIEKLSTIRKTISTFKCNGPSFRLAHQSVLAAEQCLINVPFRAQHKLQSDKRDQYFGDDEKDDKKVETDETNLRKNYRGKPYNPSDLETSLEYLKSDVYQSTYRGKPVWFYYRRNYRGHFAPPRTRPNCVVAKKLISSNPCPICRDEFLILDYRHTALLKQFINPVSGQILEPMKTGLCQHQHKKLLLEIEKAQDLGTVEMWLPFHLYDYAHYYSNLPADQFNELLRLSGCPSVISTENADSAVVSSSALATLPVNLQSLLQSVLVIPRATGVPDGSLTTTQENDSSFERPKVPNRYKMEEEYKARVARRRKSRTLILD